MPVHRVPLPAVPEPPLEPRADPFGVLVTEARGGDPAAMRRLVDRVAPALFRVVRTVLGSGRGLAEDVTQDALLATVRSLPSFRGECGFLHYSCRIAARTAMAARRARRADLEVEPLDLEQHAAPDAQLGEPGDAAARRALLRELVDELPEVQGETLILRIMLGYSMQDVADATGAPLNTVRSRLRLAKDALRRRIEESPALAELLEVG